MRIISLWLVIFFMVIDLSAQETTQVYQNNGDSLILYADVPGLLPSEFYQVRVRSIATNYEWKKSFALVSRSLWSEQEGEEESNNKKKYFTHLKDWSHTYTNIETNGTVEVELSKVSGEAINKAVVHPLSKGIATTIRNGKAYFTMQEPSLIAIDVDGQMDDQDTGNGYAGPPIHTLSVFAHPIMDKPDLNNPNVVVVQAGEPMPDPAVYETLFFGPGIHNIGREFTVHSFKKYYIPGDAIVYGTFTNMEQGNGKNIRIYGVGTISGDSISHPSYDPEYPASSSSPLEGTPWKPIGIRYSEYVEVEGVCCSNGAFHAIYLHETLPIKHTSVKWAKVLQWRQNGDGIGNAHLTEDCFIRTQDDGCYLKGDKRRNIFWNDANCATFNLAGMPDADDYSLIIEDNDVLYARNYRGKTIGSRVFSFRGVGQCDNVDVKFKNLRIEDKFITLGVYHIWATTQTTCLGNNDDFGGGLNGNLVFENVRTVSRSTTGYSDVIVGRESHLMKGFTFQNVVVDGNLIESLDDIGCYNEFVTDMSFNPGGLDAIVALSDLQVGGSTISDFSPEKEIYNIVLPSGTLNVPNVKVISSDEGAGIEINHALSLPGTTEIKVRATDNDTEMTYRVNFMVLTDSVHVTGVNISGCTSDSLGVNETLQLNAEISPADADDQKYSWTSSDSLIAVIDSSGNVFGITEGPVTLTVVTNDGAYTDECVLRVYEPGTTTASENGFVQRGIRVFPNPARERLYFDFSENPFKKYIKIYNQEGQILQALNISDSEFDINVKKFISEKVLFIMVVSQTNVSSFKVFTE